jgi:NAD(P)-dependent dehydrogenase (short-subunit alcohol dehydrogenase family)
MKSLQVEHGERVVPMMLDQSDQESCKRFGDALKDRFEQVDVLINNAGIMGSSPLLEFNMDQMDRVFATNLLGPVWLTRELLPLLKKSHDPRIINLSSGLGALNEMGGGYAAYRISKTALNAFTAILSAELNQSGVNMRVNAMCPGWVRTDMGGMDAHRSVEQGADTAVWLATVRNLPTGKFFRDRKVIPW